MIEREKFEMAAMTHGKEFGDFPTSSSVNNFL